MQRKFYTFWETSPFQIRNTLKRGLRYNDEQLRDDYKRKTARFVDLEDHEERVQDKEREAGESFRPGKCYYL